MELITYEEFQSLRGENRGGGNHKDLFTDSKNAYLILKPVWWGVWNTSMLIKEQIEDVIDSNLPLLTSPLADYVPHIHQKVMFRKTTIGYGSVWLGETEPLRASSYTIAHVESLFNAMKQTYTETGIQLSFADLGNNIVYAPEIGKLILIEPVLTSVYGVPKKNPKDYFRRLDALSNQIKKNL